jgi:hypothetical protein
VVEGAWNGLASDRSGQGLASGRRGRFAGSRDFAEMSHTAAHLRSANDDNGFGQETDSRPAVEALPACALAKIPRLYLYRVEVEIRDLNVAGLQSGLRSIPRIDAGAALMEFVAAPVRQRKDRIAVADGRKRC